MPKVDLTSRLFLFAALTALPAFAAQSDFVRVIQTSRLTEGDFTAAVSAEMQGSFAPLDQSSTGAGTGMYRGVTYRLDGGYGVKDWLSVGLQPTFRQTTPSEFALASLVPEARVRLLDTGHSPVEVSAFVDGRIRFQGRRSSTLVGGIGLDRRWQRLSFLVRVGGEKGVGPGDDGRGGRYELGVSFLLLRQFTIAAEGWGELAWVTGSPFQYSHHGGVTLKWSFGWVWVATNFSVGITDHPGATFLDYTSLLLLGVGR